jgi:NADH:ubiquinone oxidoreductase subunit 4 (subunit M)
MPARALDWPTRALCVALIVAIVALGVLPAPVLDPLTNSIALVNLPLASR